MQLYLIFLIGAVLLVPIVYASTSLSNVCAEPPDSNYVDSETCGAPTTNPETGVTKQTCCWKERTYPKVGEVTYCQTCTQDKVGGKTYCTDKEKQSLTLPEIQKSGRLQGGGVLIQPTGPNSNQSFGLKAGSVFQGQNLTFAQPNFSSNDSSNDNLAMKQSDLVSDEIQNTTTAEGDKEKQDESNTTEEPNEDQAEDAIN